MKSRILKTVGLIAAMVSCIGMTAFAAPSPAASTVVTAVSSATDTDGNAVNVSITSRSRQNTHRQLQTLRLKQN